MRLFHSNACSVSWFDIGQHIRSLKMPPRSVSAVFGTFNGERIISTTAIFCLGATQEPFRFTAMPRLKFFQGHGLPFPLSELMGVYDGIADTSMWRSGFEKLADKFYTNGASSGGWGVPLAEFSPTNRRGDLLGEAPENLTLH